MTSVFANPAAVLPQFWTKNHVIPSEATEGDFFDFIEKRSTYGSIDLASISNDFSSLKNLFDQLSEDELHPVSQWLWSQNSNKNLRIFIFIYNIDLYLQEWSEKCV